tara:strand:+ start:396 stop:737 length:342 start_codon:yes stop_codon:yes gene_type:complete
MTDETMQAAILYLRSQAFERLGRMKDIARRPTTAEDVNQISTLAAQLAQLEGAMLTLQQYAPDILAAGNQALQPTTEVEVEETEEEEESPGTITDATVESRRIRPSTEARASE